MVQNIYIPQNESKLVEHINMMTPLFQIILRQHWRNTYSINYYKSLNSIIYTPTALNTTLRSLRYTKSILSKFDYFFYYYFFPFTSSGISNQVSTRLVCSSNLLYSSNLAYNSIAFSLSRVSNFSTNPTKRKRVILIFYSTIYPKKDCVFHNGV